MNPSYDLPLFFYFLSGVEIGKYCGFVKPEAVETASNEAVVTFISDDIEYVSYRGFNLNFTASQESEYQMRIEMEMKRQ